MADVCNSGRCSDSGSWYWYAGPACRRCHSNRERQRFLQNHGLGELRLERALLPRHGFDSPPSWD
ncbi:zinc ribbon domain-containing protein [Gordonia sp. OPL2]|uniref:zinc ribbon domain-containing protein n=1 Tax=Gordonia sp. OPL2 TaxID=2486274 RepID=UPI00165558D2|nr:hypothetical protein EEB19_06385 [Gordonia sp. OPL2]